MGNFSNILIQWTLFSLIFLLLLRLLLWESRTGVSYKHTWMSAEEWHIIKGQDEESISFPCRSLGQVLKKQNRPKKNLSLPALAVRRQSIFCFFWLKFFRLLDKHCFVLPSLPFCTQVMDALSSFVWCTLEQFEPENHTSRCSTNPIWSYWELCSCVFPSSCWQVLSLICMQSYEPLTKILLQSPLIKNI